MVRLKPYSYWDLVVRGLGTGGIFRGGACSLGIRSF